MRVIEDQVGFVGTLTQIKEESGKRFCKAFGVKRRNAYKNVNCPLAPVDIMYVGCKSSWPPYHFNREAIGNHFQIRQFIGGSLHVVAMNYSSGCLDPCDNYLFEVLDWNDYS